MNDRISVKIQIRGYMLHDIIRWLTRKGDWMLNEKKKKIVYNTLKSRPIQNRTSYYRVLHTY